MLRAADIHAQIGAGWPAVLVRLGIPEESLRPKKAGPCPACGGRDRFTFDNRKLRGDFICRGCGAGDGFGLLMRVYGWGFSEARRRVLQAAVIEIHDPSAAPTGHDQVSSGVSTSSKLRETGRSCPAIMSNPNAWRWRAAFWRANSCAHHVLSGACCAAAAARRRGKLAF